MLSPCFRYSITHHQTPAEAHPAARQVAASSSAHSRCIILTYHVESTRDVEEASSCWHVPPGLQLSMSTALLPPRSVMAARLREARQLRGLSQREVGVRMGLDKDTASARISRYESESMAISLDSLFVLAGALDVPPAYLLASTSAMADAILSLGAMSESQQGQLAAAVTALAKLSSIQRTALIERITNSGSERES